MDKFYNEEGKVAILISSGYGAGWSTWGNSVGMETNPRLVKAVLSGDVSEMMEVAAQEYPDEYLGGVSDLFVEWVTPGVMYRIDEYDGTESLELCEIIDWKIA